MSCSIRPEYHRSVTFTPYAPFRRTAPTARQHLGGLFPAGAVGTAISLSRGRLLQLYVADDSPLGDEGQEGDGAGQHDQEGSNDPPAQARREIERDEQIDRVEETVDWPDHVDQARLIAKVLQRH